MTVSTTLTLLIVLVAASSWKQFLRPHRVIPRLQSTTSSTTSIDQESMDDQRTPFTIGTVIGNGFDKIAFNSNVTKSLRFSGHFSKQHVIKFSSPPKRVFLLAKPEEEVVEPFKHAVRRLCGLGMTVFADDINYAYLYEECYDEFQSLFHTQASTSSSSSSNNSSSSGGCIRLLTNQTLPTVDLIITFGGDGLLMHVNTLFESARAVYGYDTRTMPPIMSFDFGSLGFLAPFQFEDFDAEVDYVLNNAALLTLRQRLKCTVWKSGVNTGTFHVLNEAVVDRGPSPYLSAIELTCDGQYLTTVQGDGVIVATPTGSTAYSLAAGGSMVHPSVPAMLLTPICAHTLSFRPLMLPDSSVLSCAVPADSRSTAWVCFDGKFRQELQRGDRLDVQVSSVPLPTINRKNFTGDWFDALRNGFMFNQRPRQKPISSINKKPTDN